GLRGGEYERRQALRAQVLRVAGHEPDRAEQRGALAERPGSHVQRGCERGQRVALDGGANAVDDRAGTQLAAHPDPARIDVVAPRREPPPERTAGVVQYAAAAEIAIGSQLEDPRQREVAAVDRPQDAQHRAGRRDRLQAAALSTAAQLAVVAQPHVAELAGD